MMATTLRKLSYIDGYRLFHALKDGSQVAFTVATNPATTYTAQFHGKKIGTDNYLEVSNGNKTQQWGWGYNIETVFQCLDDIENDRFSNPAFKYRTVIEQQGSEGI